MNEISDKSKNKIVIIFFIHFLIFLKVWNFWLKSKEKKIKWKSTVHVIYDFFLQWKVLNTNLCFNSWIKLSFT